jgi:c-di-GMP-binding flagellar brake protein YcgR
MTSAVRLELYTLTGTLRVGALAADLDEKSEIDAQIVTLDGAVELLDVGLELEGFFTKPGDASYGFITRVRSLDSKTGQLQCTPPQSIHRLQRREFLRIEISLPVAVAVAGPRRDKEPGPDGWCQATAFDMSAAGLGVTCAQVLPVGQVVIARFSLPTRHGPLEIENRALITRISLDAQAPDSGLLAYGLVLVDLPRILEESMVAAVHWLQTAEHAD